jgi:putative dehydrogenase
MSAQEGYRVAVVGIGAMGGGMARSLLDSSACKSVAGYDRSPELVDAFHKEAEALGKAPSSQATTLVEAVKDCDFCLLVLVNEMQCEQVCFGSGDGDNLLSILPKGSCLILSSTVTAVWARKACKKFEAAGVMFVDCPISGGPVRARQGDLTLMASASPDTLTRVQPLLEAMGREGQIHIIPGGAGMGSTVKMVHQLLAGVHVVVAAEALALAAKAGLDVEQMYTIVNGAAGASWMFQDRGQRMIAHNDPEEVKSALEIFVKDLDIVHAEAKRLQVPTPVASAALQQFISGQSLGLSRKDDSQVVKVYENVTGVVVAKNSSLAAAGGGKKQGENVGDLWKMQDGTEEEILEVGSEPRHNVILSNEYVRALRVSFPPNDTTLAHRHAEDSLYFFLVQGGLEVLNHVQGNLPACDCMDFGEVRFGTHKSDKPLVHKITNTTDKLMLCIDAEVLKQPPVTAAIPLVAEKHELIKTREKCRVYRLTLEPGESVTVSYPFFHFSVILQPSAVEKTLGSASPAGIRWIETPTLGDVAWKEPMMDVTKTNVGDSTFVEYIAEWR